MQKTRLAFCANEQIEVNHTVTIDNNGEYLFECDCGRFFKLAGNLDKAGIKEALSIHKASNLGQVTQELIEAENAEKLKNI